MLLKFSSHGVPHSHLTNNFNNIKTCILLIFQRFITIGHQICVASFFIFKFQFANKQFFNEFLKNKRPHHLVSRLNLNAFTTG